MGASLLVAHLNGGVAFADNTTTIESMLSVMSSTSQATAWRLRGTSGATIDELKTYASANTTLVTTTITARKNGTGQSLSVSYTSGQTGEKQDTTNSFSASSGDDIDVSVAVANDASGAKTIKIHSITMRCTPTTSGDTVCRVGANTSSAGVAYSTASQVNYFAAGALGSNTTERPLRALGSFTLSNLQTHVTANARTTTTTYRSRKNGANGAQSVSYTSGQTGAKEDTTNTDSISSGDDWCMSQTTSTGTGSITVLACSMALLSTAGEFELVAADVVGTGYPNSSTRYGCVSGPFTYTNTTESNAQSRGFAATYTNLRAYCPANTAGSDSTVTLRVEGADSALSVTYTSGQTGLKTDTDTVAVSADDLLGYKVVAGSGSSNTLTLTSIAVTGYTASGSALNVNLSDSVTSSDALTKSLTLAKADAGSVADAVAKATALAKADSATTTDVLAKMPTLLKADGATASDAVAKALGLVEADAASVVDALAKLLTKALNDAATPGDALEKAATLAKADSATATDSVARAVGKVAADVASVVDVLAKAAALTLADTAAVADVLAKAMGLQEADAASAADAVAKLVGLLSSDTVTLEDLAAARLVIIPRVWLYFDVTVQCAVAASVTVSRAVDADVSVCLAVNRTVEVT